MEGSGKDERDGREAKDKVEAAAATSAAKAKALDPKITDDDAVVGVETGLITPGREPLVFEHSRADVKREHTEASTRAQNHVPSGASGGDIERQRASDKARTSAEGEGGSSESEHGGSAEAGKGAESKRSFL